MSVVTVPQPVRIAVLVVWGILGLLLLRTILTFVFADDLVDAWIADSQYWKSVPRELAESAAPRYSAVAIGVLVVAAVLAFTAIHLNKAARWARVVALVFAALTLLGVVVSLIAPTIPLLLIINVVAGLLSVAAMVLLLTGDANRFFAK